MFSSFARDTAESYKVASICQQKIETSSSGSDDYIPKITIIHFIQSCSEVVQLIQVKCQNLDLPIVYQTMESIKNERCNFQQMNHPSKKKLK